MTASAGPIIRRNKHNADIRLRTSVTRVNVARHPDEGREE